MSDFSNMASGDSNMGPPVATYLASYMMNTDKAISDETDCSA